MRPLRKLMITPFYGDLPPWFDKFVSNFEATLAKQGYDWLRTHDLDDFNKRCINTFDFQSPIISGSPKVWDYRCALGLLYADYLEGYDYWGHMDFDMVFGEVSAWFPDEEIKKVELWSNHHSYVNGCFSLYRNSTKVNCLFKKIPNWERILQSPVTTGWVEKEYSQQVQRDLNYRYSFHQGWPYTTEPNLYFRDGRLYQDGEQIAMFHFRRSKRFPL